MTHIEKRSAYKQRDALVRILPQRKWYEHVGAQIMALACGVAMAALRVREGNVTWRQLLIEAAIVFVAACLWTIIAALVDNVRRESARADVSRGTLQKLKGAAPTTGDVPPEHRRQR